jgi:hypothetical protein
MIEGSMYKRDHQITVGLGYKKGGMKQFDLRPRSTMAC